MSSLSRLEFLITHSDGEYIIEDDFTKRVSLATSIKGCLDAITDEEVDGYFIYAVRNSEIDRSYLLNLSTIQCPDGYGVDFDFREWLKSNGVMGNYYAPSKLPQELKEKFYGCVPDVNISGEYWYLSDLKMNYVGEVIPWKYGINKIVK